MDNIVMRIKRSEYFDLTNKVNTLTAENEGLKTENASLKNKLIVAEKKATENKTKKEANK